MNGDTSIYSNIAWIFIGAMAVVGLGLLFVRATNIERPNLVAASTLGFCAMAALLVAKGSQPSGPVMMWGAIAICLFGFLGARVLDVLMGARKRVHHDPATLDADLAD